MIDVGGWFNNKTPIIGKELAKIGKIYNAAALPCQPTPEMWVYGFFYGIPHMLWTLYKPDPIDYAWDRTGLRRGLKRRQRFKIKEDLSNRIPATPTLTWIRWAGDWVQRVGWWMLIVDAALDHAVWWESAAMQWAGCQQPGQPYAQGEATDIGMSHYPQWQNIDLAVVHYNIFAGGIGQVIVPGAIPYSAGFSVTSIGNPIVPEWYQSTVAEWRILAEGDVIAQGSTTPNADGVSHSGAGFIFKPNIFVGSRTLSFQTRLNRPGSCLVTHAAITVSGAALPLNTLGQGDP